MSQNDRQKLNFQTVVKFDPSKTNNAEARRKAAEATIPEKPSKIQDKRS